MYIFDPYLRFVPGFGDFILVMLNISVDLSILNGSVAVRLRLLPPFNIIIHTFYLVVGLGVNFIDFSRSCRWSSRRMYSCNFWRCRYIGRTF
jgi:hypothetical protein